MGTRFLTLSFRMFFFLALALEIASVASLLRRSEDSLAGISSSGILVAVLLFRSSLSSDSSRVSFPAPCLVTLPQSFRTFSGSELLLLFRSDCELRLSFLRLSPETSYQLCFVTCFGCFVLIIIICFGGGGNFMRFGNFTRLRLQEEKSRG